ncbi:CPBP family intramembrane metalloprotease [Bifidobacterium sp. MA2]|uniref:CPBP family intramembrane metalloprotease n=1 Tax=Bifidobacterium santillanense TaxID=2809028 RepID=A0ABS5USN1_9BIFI|nr:CPBP family intramembrane glutamic endopeptidase [Bifidobacterium santillanense]MBT1173783.1 CPBP family intramembrane metalloprotease [Bifidobacterium santillanense]
MLLGRAPSIRRDDLLTDDHPLRRYDPREPKRFRPWARGLAFVGLLLGGMIVVGIVVGVIMAFALPSDVFHQPSFEGGKIVMSSMTPAVKALTSIVELIAAIVAYAIVVRVMEGRRAPIELAPRRAFDAVRGIVAAFVCISVCIGVIALFGGYRIVGFNAGYSPWGDLLRLGFTAGIAEEIMMRGVLLRLTEERLGSWGAVILSALIFGLAHLANQDGTVWGGLAIAIEAGLLFGAVYLATRSLWWCMGFHFMWNIAEGPIFGSVVSGNGDQQSWFVAQWSGPDILTGGAFGLEASIVPVILLGGIAVALLVHLQHLGLMIEPIGARKRRLGVPETSRRR